MIRSWLAALLLAFACSGLASGPSSSSADAKGCAPGFTQPSLSVLSRELAQAQARWKASGVRAYSFDFEQIAQPVRFPKMRITILDRRVSSVRPLEPGTVSSEAAHANVEVLFLFIQGYVASPARHTPCIELKVEYAPDGHPVRFASELRMAGVMDGGANWTVSNFRRR